MGRAGTPRVLCQAPGSGRHRASAQPQQVWGGAWGVLALQTGLTPSRTRAGAWPDTRPRPTLAGPTGTLRGEGTLQSQHSPCRMRQKNQTSMGTGTGEVAPWCPHGGVTECVSGPRAWAERSQVASAVWQAGEAGPVFPPSRCGTLLPLADRELCPRMSGLAVPSSAPFPGLHLSVFFPV